MLPASTKNQSLKRSDTLDFLLRTGNVSNEVCSVNNIDLPKTTRIKPTGYTKAFNFHIKCALFSLFKKAVTTQINRKLNPISSPALSLDRLEISYGSQKKIMISPKDKTGFLQAIGQNIDGSNG